MNNWIYKMPNARILQSTQSLTHADNNNPSSMLLDFLQYDFQEICKTDFDSMSNNFPGIYFGMTSGYSNVDIAYYFWWNFVFLYK